MTTVVKEIIKEVPFLKETKKKEAFLFVVGALILRLVSLRKAAEIMNTDEKTFLNLLDFAGVDFSYLEGEDVRIERKMR